MKGVLGGLFCALCLASASEGAEFFGLGDLPGGRFESLAFRVSGDGSTVVGYSQSAASGTRNEAFRWTRATGMVSLGDLPGGDHYGAGIGVSYNGSVVVGSSSSRNGEEAFRWTSSTGMVDQGDLPGGLFSSQFQSTSADGAMAVGDGYSAHGYEATRWTSATGMVGLGELPGGIYQSQAFDVSADGSVIVGASFSGPELEAFRWTQETGMVGLGDLPSGETRSVANSVSADGRVIVGQGKSIFGGEAFRWTADEGMVGLGNLPGQFLSSADAVSGDGSVIVGQSGGAFIWTEETGMRSLKEVLQEQGVDLGGWSPYAPRGISWDGRVVVGWGNNPHFDNEAWMAILSTNDSTTGGDTDADGDVDLDDLNNVRNHFGEMGVPVSGDTNEDYIVDLDDLNAVRNNFGSVAPQSVPEPSSLAVLFWGVAGLALSGVPCNGKESLQIIGTSRFASIVILLLSSNWGRTESVIWNSVEGGNSHAYEYVGDFVAWPEAAARSASASVPVGYWFPRLISISTAPENSFVRSLITDTIWLGISDAEAEGEWRWLDDTPGVWQDPDNFPSPIQTAWVNWSGEEPNDTSPGEDYGSMDSLDPLGTWNDGSLDGAKYAYVIESVPGIFGDTNGDLRVDLADLNAVRNHFGEGSSGGPEVLGEAYPPDGVIDLIDLNLVRNRFGISLPQAVPEPASRLLLVLGVALLSLGYRRE